MRAFLATSSSCVWIASAALAVLAAAGCNPKEAQTMGKAKPDQAKPVAAEIKVDSGRRETAMFAAGCFWGVEAAFRQVVGVTATTVGYSGGHAESPTYAQVCTDRTGHAETVQVQFDPAQVSYERLLDVFWTCHDPTQVNRQGPDVGSQYRSAIFYMSPQQQRAAEASKARLAASGKFARPMATEIAAAGTFYRAEEYHQQYLEKNGRAACPAHLK